MQSYARLDTMDHLGADSRVVDVCADVDAGEDRHDMGVESVTHSDYHHMINLRHVHKLGCILPINRSGRCF